MTYTAAQAVDAVTNLTIPLVVRWGFAFAAAFVLGRIVLHELAFFVVRRIRHRVYCEHCGLLLVDA